MIMISSSDDKGVISSSNDDIVLDILSPDDSRVIMDDTTVETSSLGEFELVDGETVLEMTRSTLVNATEMTADRTVLEERLVMLVKTDAEEVMTDRSVLGMLSPDDVRFGEGVACITVCVVGTIKGVGVGKSLSPGVVLSREETSSKSPLPDMSMLEYRGEETVETVVYPVSGSAVASSATKSSVADNSTVMLGSTSIDKLCVKSYNSTA